MGSVTGAAPPALTSAQNRFGLYRAVLSHSTLFIHFYSSMFAHLRHVHLGGAFEQRPRGAPRLRLLWPVLHVDRHLRAARGELRAALAERAHLWGGGV